jgi:hypothetical protein
MASTRNKNSPGDYKAEQAMNNHIEGYRTYIHSSTSKANTNHLPGRGVLPASNARDELCGNYCDVESQLKGIGSTNLVTPKAPVVPEFKTPKSLNFIDGLQVSMPEPLVIEKNQRPYLN